MFRDKIKEFPEFLNKGFRVRGVYPSLVGSGVCERRLWYTIKNIGKIVDYSFLNSEAMERGKEIHRVLADFLSELENTNAQILYSSEVSISFDYKVIPIRGRIDAIVDDNETGDKYLIEFKTYEDKSLADWDAWKMQITVYCWGWFEKYGVWRIPLIIAVQTDGWKAIDVDVIEVSLDEIQQRIAILKNRFDKVLTNMGDPSNLVAVPNVFCYRCPYHAECMGGEKVADKMIGKQVDELGRINSRINQLEKEKKMIKGVIEKYMDRTGNTNLIGENYIVRGKKVTRQWVSIKKGMEDKAINEGIGEFKKSEYWQIRTYHK